MAIGGIKRDELSFPCAGKFVRMQGTAPAESLDVAVDMLETGLKFTTSPCLPEGQGREVTQTQLRLR